MTDEELAAIEARAAAATPGPWDAGADHARYGMYSVTAKKDVFDAGLYYSSSWVEISEADATFIAHARTDVPALVAEVRRLQREAAA